MSSKLTFYNNRIEIQCDASDKGLLDQIYPLFVNRKHTLYTCSIRKAPEVLKLFRGITAENIAEAPEQIQSFFMSEMNKREVLQDRLANGPIGNPVVNSRLTLRPHQQVARELAEHFDKFAFFYDTRTGKTPLSISIIRDDLLKNPTHKWLVVCPLILIENAWVEDLKKFLPSLKYTVLHGANKAERLAKFKQQSNLYIINTEAFSSYYDNIKSINFAGCFIDESSDMKSHSSKISKALVDYSQIVPRFYLLSGVPAPNGEWEYYMQIRAVDFYGMPSSYTQFQNKFFVNVSRNPQYTKLALIPSMKEALFSLIKPNALYVDKEDVLTTPGRTFIELEFDLPPDLKKQYNQLKEDLFLEVSQGLRITAPSAAAKLNKLNQVTSGFIIDTKATKANKYYGTDDPEWYLLNSYRFNLLLELLESIGDEQVIIWCNYRKEFEVLQSLLGNTCRCVYGAVSLEDKTNAIKDFKAKKVQYLIANPASADKGLTLTSCHIAVYFSLNYSYELFKQSAERIYGDVRSQPLHCNYYIMIAKGTIDRVLYSEVLQTKKILSYAILDHLKGGVL